MAFKKGEDKNRFSSPLPVGDDIKAARKLTLADFERVGHKIWFMGFHEIVKAMNSTKEGKADLPAGEMALMSTLYHGIKDGDQKRIDFFLNRLIGPIPHRIRNVISVEENVEVPVKMTTEEKLQMIDVYKQMIQEADLIEVENDDSDSRKG